MVEGCREKVKEFVDSVQSIPQWRFYNVSRMTLGREEMRFDCYFDKKPERESESKLTERSISKLMITSEKGVTMEIVLLDAEVIQMGNGITYVHGKNYDPFSVGKSECKKKDQ